MDSDRLQELVDALLITQLRKSVGLIDPSQLKRFVEFVEATEDRLKDASREAYKFSVRATLAPRTTEKEYSDYKYPVAVGYVGPYAVAHYDGDQYSFERIKDHVDSYQADQEHVGMEVEVEFSGSVCLSLKDLIEITQGRSAPSATSVIPKKDGSLVFSFFVPNGA